MLAILTLTLAPFIRSATTNLEGLFYIQQRFLFKRNMLCIHKTSLRIALVTEVCDGSSRGHVRIQNTLDMLAQNFY